MPLTICNVAVFWIKRANKPLLRWMKAYLFSFLKDTVDRFPFLFSKIQWQIKISLNCVGFFLWLLDKAKNTSAIYLLRRVLVEGHKGKVAKGSRSNRRPTVERIETTSQHSNKQTWWTTSPLNLLLLSLNWLNHRDGRWPSLKYLIFLSVDIRVEKKPEYSIDIAWLLEWDSLQQVSLWEDNLTVDT